MFFNSPHPRPKSFRYRIDRYNFYLLFVKQKRFTFDALRQRYARRHADNLKYDMDSKVYYP